MNLTEAANTLHMTKGAVSYQIKKLEEQLGFDVFVRQHGGISFSRKGAELYTAMSNLFEQAEQHIQRIAEDTSNYLTVGMTTYFASRWLTPRLMRFTSEHPEIRLRIQPTMGMVDVQKENIDMAIQWGDGHWNDVTVEPLFLCPAFPTAGTETFHAVQKYGLKQQLGKVLLLHDFDQSLSWDKWAETAAIPLPSKGPSLVIPDPNVRVEAVINEQGIALNDALVSAEIDRGALHQISDIRLENFGYFLTFNPHMVKSGAFTLFREWLFSEVDKPAKRQTVR